MTDETEVSTVSEMVITGKVVPKEWELFYIGIDSGVEVLDRSGDIMVAVGEKGKVANAATP